MQVLSRTWEACAHNSNTFFYLTSRPRPSTQVTMLPPSHPPTLHTPQPPNTHARSPCRSCQCRAPAWLSRGLRVAAPPHPSPGHTSHTPLGGQAAPGCGMQVMLALSCAGAQECQTEQGERAGNRRPQGENKHSDESERLALVYCGRDCPPQPHPTQSDSQQHIITKAKRPYIASEPKEWVCAASLRGMR